MEFETNYKKFLEEAGFNDENMSKNEMMDCYKAITNSKNTANQEQEQQALSKQKEDSTVDLNRSSSTEHDAKEKFFAPKQWSKQRKLSDDLSKLITEEASPSRKSKEYEGISFQDMPEVFGDSLEILYHKPIYKLPIPTNPRYQHFNLKRRTKMLYDYHTSISAIKSKLARTSLHAAPQSKPILPSVKCKVSLLRSVAEDEPADIFDDMSDDFYVSRSGRQVKRKIYTEDSETDSDNPLFIANKRNKSGIGDTKITLESPLTLVEDNSKISPFSVSEFAKSTPKSVKTKKIIHSETPKRLPITTKRLTRSETLFNNLVQEEEKRRQEEEEISAFEKTLDALNEEDTLTENIHNEDVVAIEHTEENFVKRRVVPPLRGRKAINGRKRPINQEDMDAIDVIPEPQPKTLTKQYTYRRGENVTKRNIKTLKSDENSTDASSTQSSEEDKVNCPICNKSFNKVEVQKHAATCGENLDEVESSSTAKYNPLTCNLCDQTFRFGSDYEVHVKECIASNITRM